MNAREWRTLALASFLGVPVQFLIQFYGLSLTTVSHASLMVGTMPVILAVGAALFAHERLDHDGLGGAGGFDCGRGADCARQACDVGAGDPSLAGDLLVVLSLVIALFWILLNKRLMDAALADRGDGVWACCSGR